MEGVSGALTEIGGCSAGAAAGSLDAIRRSAQEAGENEDKALMRRALIGWENDLQDAETGEPIAFSDDNRDLLLALLPVRNAVAHAYFASISNGMIRRKN